MSLFDMVKRRYGDDLASLNAMYHITESGKDHLDRSYDVTSKGRILNALSEQGSMTGKQLASEARLNNTQTALWLTKLERWGLVASVGGESFDPRYDGHRGYDEPR